MMKLFRNARDPISSETHIIGAIASIILFIAMMIVGKYKDTSMSNFIGALVFGLSAIALYFASGIYHYMANDPQWMRKIDHSMIYVLIAGTYTPVTLAYVAKPHCYYFLAILWVIAVIGIIGKIFWINAPRYFSTLIYLIMGWAVVFDFKAFQMPSLCFWLILAGGIAYSIGAVIYATKKPDIFKKFGFHEIFHVFVMIGSLFHFIAMFTCIL